jgi:hypothetical protein
MGTSADYFGIVVPSKGSASRISLNYEYPPREHLSGQAEKFAAITGHSHFSFALPMIGVLAKSSCDY